MFTAHKVVTFSAKTHPKNFDKPYDKEKAELRVPRFDFVKPISFCRAGVAIVNPLRPKTKHRIVCHEIHVSLLATL